MEPYILYGRCPVQEYTRHNRGYEDIDTIYIAEGFPAKLRKLILSGVPARLIQEFPKKRIDSMFPNIHHQGVVVKFRQGRDVKGVTKNRDSRKSMFSEGAGLMVALDRMQDPHNVGSIIRSAEVLGVRRLFLTGRGCGLTPAVDRVAAGATVHLEIQSVPSLDRLIEVAKKNGYWICTSSAEYDLSRKGWSTTTDTQDDDVYDDDDEAADMMETICVKGDSTSSPEEEETLSGEQIHSSEFGQLILSTDDMSALPDSNSILLVIGNEGEGVKPLAIKKCDYLLSIPTRGKTSSLNAGVAAGILIDRLMNRP